MAVSCRNFILYLSFFFISFVRPLVCFDFVFFIFSAIVKVQVVLKGHQILDFCRKIAPNSFWALVEVVKWSA